MSPLVLLLLAPVAGAVAVALAPRQRLAWSVALAASAATLAVAWSLLMAFDPSQAGLQFAESYRWNPRLGMAFSVGVDGFSLPLVLLATLLALVAVLASASVRQGFKGYFALLLLLEAAMLGVFTAQDWALFYVFWELTLIPLFFLIDRWGGKRRQAAAMNFVLYTMGGSVFMLMALLIAFDTAPGHSFDMATLTAGARTLPTETQVLLFLGFLIGFGVKMPIVPLHGWLPLAHVDAPSPVSILLSGALLKMGSYGLLRVAEMLPAAVQALQGPLATLGFLSLLYGGILAWRQSDLKALVAYSSVSHMGVVLVGIATLNPAGLTGAVMQMVAHGLVAGALFLLIGLLYERTHTRELADYSSLVRVTPRFAFFTTLAFVATVGLPGTVGFVAELHAIVGSFQRWGWTAALLSLGMLVSAAYAIRTVDRLFTGPVRDRMREVPDLRVTELAAAATLGVTVVALGVFPTPALELMGASVARLGALFGGAG
jgi:NADH-quinone oxidoreductase subunit M